MMNLQLGYALNQSKDQEKKALELAFDLISQSKRKGLNMRDWAGQTNLSSQKLLEKIQEKSQISLPVQLWEISNLEKKILVGLRDYMSDISDKLIRIKSLNPPLKSDQIKLFLEALVAERDLTVTALAPLTQTVASLNEIKLSLSNNALPTSFGYSPSA
ncbi:MAG: hypothetical protein KCHDKBKB_02033 [Elusimicrobia bacterium]|nr:hypothetical protein [Elusimicrobiota bacterium]